MAEESHIDHTKARGKAASLNVRGLRFREREKPEENNWKPLFLKALSESPNISRAAREAGTSRTTAYEEKAKDAVFSAAWDEVLEAAVDDLEEIAMKRAKESAKSDVLTIFLLKAHRPAVYKDVVRIEQEMLVKCDVTIPTRKSGAKK